MAEYEDFRLRLISTGPGSYTVLANSPKGEARSSFRLPFSGQEIEMFILRIAAARGIIRRGGSSTAKRQLEHQAMEFGGKLFAALIDGPVRDRYRAATESADEHGRGLRVVLTLRDAPELMELPWEFLYDRPNFLGLRLDTPVVRHLDLPRRRRPMSVEGPLRILGMVSSPSGYVHLDTEKEIRVIETALKRLTERGLVEVEWMTAATLRELQIRLGQRESSFHVFHYIGHGEYDSPGQNGELVLEDRQGRPQKVTGAELGTILCDHRSMRLAVLNACEGARTSATDPFAGVATSLVEREIPAVIAMQFEISDGAAIVFAEEFYRALVDGYPVDLPVVQARKAMYAEGTDIEWGTPVMFLRSDDAHLFDVAATEVPARLPKPELVASGQSQPAVPRPTEGESSRDDVFIPWSAGDLARFEASGTKTAASISAMMDMLAEKPGEYLNTSQIVVGISVSRDELRGALSALSRHIRKHYNRTNWPFTLRWGSGQAEYAISDGALAKTWLKVRKTHGERSGSPELLLELEPNSEEGQQPDGYDQQSAVPPHVHPFQSYERTFSMVPIEDGSRAPLLGPPAAEEAIEVPGQPVYTESMVRRLVDDVSHLPAVISLFRLVSDRPGEVVTFEDVVEASGLAVGMARGQMSALSRRVQSAVGVKGWPIEWSWAPDGTIRYRADPRIAQWLRSALERTM
jgi:hypothetical protein